MIVACPVGAADGLPLGFHLPTVPDSSVADLVCDTAAGDLVVPEHLLAPYGLVIVCHKVQIFSPRDEVSPERRLAS